MPPSPPVLRARLADAGPERMGVLGLEVVDRLESLAALLAVEVDARRIVLEDALGAANRVEAVVRGRRGDGVLQQNGLAAHRLDQRGVDVAGDVVSPATWANPSARAPRARATARVPASTSTRGSRSDRRDGCRDTRPPVRGRASDRNCPGGWCAGSRRQSPSSRSSNSSARRS